MSNKTLTSIVIFFILILLFKSKLFESNNGTPNSHYHNLSETTNAVNFKLKIADLLTQKTQHQFAEVTEDYSLVFPKDHGPHPDFRTEWWYVTGNLFDKKNNRFGFQLTFFRQRLSPNNNEQGWKNNTISMAHFAVSDHATGKFIANEKFARDGAQVAGAQAIPFKVWLDDWEIKSKENNNDFFPLELQAKNSLLSLNLQLSAQKPITLQGKQGFSQKGEHSTNASHYYSFTRLKTHGILRYHNDIQNPLSLKGYSWLDREWSSSALSEEQQGWDWFALQLNNGDDIMFYNIRDHDGTNSQFSDGIIVTADKQKIKLTPKNLSITPLQYWISPHGQKYPIQWSMRIQDDRYNANLIIQTPIKDQWLNLSIRYWEGAINVYDNDNQKLLGYGFLEMAGYPDSQ